MEINREKLWFYRVTINNNVYNVLNPQNIEEFIYGINNDLLIPNETTKIRDPKLIILYDLKSRLN